MTFMLGSCEREPIKPSVRPSPKYSLLGSEVALTKGSTAMEVICCVSDLPRTKYTPATAATTKTATMPATQYFRERPTVLAAGEDADAGTATAAESLDERPPDSMSRLSRARSVRRSAAL